MSALVCFALWLGLMKAQTELKELKDISSDTIRLYIFISLAGLENSSLTYRHPKGSPYEFNLKSPPYLRLIASLRIFAKLKYIES